MGKAKLRRKIRKLLLSQCPTQYTNWHHSGKSTTIRESNHGLGVYKEAITRSTVRSFLSTFPRKKVLKDYSRYMIETRCAENRAYDHAYLMPRSHIHGSPRRFYYGLNLTDDPGNANFRSPIRMHYMRMIKYHYV